MMGKPMDPIKAQEIFKKMLIEGRLEGEENEALITGFLALTQVIREEMEYRQKEKLKGDSL